MDKISNNNRLPLYYQLYDIIVEKIHSGIYNEDDKLPSERELCEKYDISRATVRRAMVELEKNDYIYKKQGKGVFISSKAFEQDLLSFYSFSEEMKKIGKKPSSIVIDFEIEKSDAKISEILDVDINTEVYKFTRLRLADGDPMMLETTYLPTERFRGLSRELLNNNAMYDIFSNKYNVVFDKAEETFQATAITSEEEKHLEVKENSPAILLKRLTYENEKVIEYTISVTRGDKFKFHVVLE